jgi:hypothetical protein
MLDLIHLAYQADMTRVISFAIAKEQGSKDYSNIGVPEGHHECSHHQNDPYKQAQLSKINIYHIKLLNAFLEKMRRTNDGDGSLLDHTLILFGSGMSDSNLHLPRNVPTIVVGGKTFDITGGQHMRVADQTPLCNLHLTLMDKMGVPVEQFGDSNGRLKLVSM